MRVYVVACVNAPPIVCDAALRPLQSLVRGHVVDRFENTCVYFFVSLWPFLRRRTLLSTLHAVVSLAVCGNVAASNLSRPIPAV